MKRQIREGILFLMMILIFPAMIALGIFFIPPRYDNTFLGELKEKRERLAGLEGKKIVLIGGSSVVFGVDSELIHREFPEYEVVNFGMYAALGTKVMLDLSKDYIREGDLVLIIPEQQSQTLSMYFNGEYMWQALDGAFGMLSDIPWDNKKALLGAAPQFSAEKWKYLFTGTVPKPSGVYRRDSFDEYGDLDSSEAASNIMAGGFDENMPIRFEKEMLEEGFADYLNQYAKEAKERGAAVWYHFCPMNARAVVEESDVDGYYEYLQRCLDFDIAGNPHDCIMEAGWFYDTNFHLNSAGKRVFVKQLIKDMKAMLGDSSPTDIEIPEMPAAESDDKRSVPEERSEDGSCFQWETEGVETRVEGSREEKNILTLSHEAKTQKEELTVPLSCDGISIRRVNAELFSGNKKIRRIILQENIGFIEDGSFNGCDSLEVIELLESNPEKISVGQKLLEGTDCRIAVPAGSVNDYKLNYMWSVYGDRIVEAKE